MAILNRSRASARRWVLITLLWVSAQVVGAQTEPTSTPTSTPVSATTQAATQPTTAPVNPLRSPFDAMQRFLTTVEAAIAGEGDFAEPMRIMDFGDLAQDVEKLQDEGPEYVRKLYEIVRRLESEGFLNLQDEKLLLKDPAAVSPQSFGRDPFAMSLVRVPRKVAGTERVVQEWRFSASTVARVPSWHEQLDELVADARSKQRATDDFIDVCRTPRGLVEYFLQNAADARKQNEEAFKSALACLDFSLVLAEGEGVGEEARQRFMEDQAPTYIDTLERVLDYLISSAALVLEKLPAEPDAGRKPTYSIGVPVEPGGTAREIMLVRRGNVAAGRGQWRFSAQTVKELPELADLLKRTEDAAKKTEPSAPAVTAAPAETAAPVAAPVASKEPAPAPLPSEETRSARATFETFLSAVAAGDVQVAESCLDLSEWPQVQQGLAKNMAGRLWLSLARYPKPLPQEIPDDPFAVEPYKVLEHKVWRIQIGPVRTEDGKLRWLFTSASVRNIEPLYEALKDRPVHEDWAGQHLPFWSWPSLYVREYVVPPGFDQTFWGLKVWQWIGIGLVLLLGVVVYLLAQLVMPGVAQRILRTEGAAMLPQVLRRAVRPTSVMLMLGGWGLGLQLLDLGSVIMSWTLWGLKIVAAIAGVFAIFRLTDVIMGYFAARAGRTTSRLDDVLIPLAQKTLKVVVVALGTIVIISAFGYEVDKWLAALGVGGLAISFAAKDTIANFFGSVNVVLDRPFQVGDWVKIGSSEGTVESVGLRSSRLRTFYNSQMTIPNAEIMTAIVDNMGRRRYRRTNTVISVTYDSSPEKLEAFCEGIRELIRQHPMTRKDYFHVYVKEFAASSIDIMLYCFHECPDWGIELRERHRLFLDIIRLAKRVGIEFAFPTQTLHVYNEEPVDEATRPRIPDSAADAEQFGIREAQAILKVEQERAKGGKQD